LRCSRRRAQSTTARLRGPRQRLSQSWLRRRVFAHAPHQARSGAHRRSRCRTQMGCRALTTACKSVYSPHQQGGSREPLRKRPDVLPVAGHARVELPRIRTLRRFPDFAADRARPRVHPLRQEALRRRVADFALDTPCPFARCARASSRRIKGGHCIVGQPNDVAMQDAPQRSLSCDRMLDGIRMQQLLHAIVHSTRRLPWRTAGW